MCTRCTVRAPTSQVLQSYSCCRNSIHNFRSLMFINKCEKLFDFGQIVEIWCSSEIRSVHIHFYFTHADNPVSYVKFIDADNLAIFSCILITYSCEPIPDYLLVWINNYIYKISIYNVMKPISSENIQLR